MDTSELKMRLVSANMYRLRMWGFVKMELVVEWWSIRSKRRVGKKDGQNGTRLARARAKQRIDKDQRENERKKEESEKRKQTGGWGWGATRFIFHQFIHGDGPKVPHVQHRNCTSLGSKVHEGEGDRDNKKVSERNKHAKAVSNHTVQALVP